MNSAIPMSLRGGALRSTVQHAWLTRATKLVVPCTLVISAMLSGCSSDTSTGTSPFTAAGGGAVAAAGATAAPVTTPVANPTVTPTSGAAGAGAVVTTGGAAGAAVATPGAAGAGAVVTTGGAAGAAVATTGAAGAAAPAAGGTTFTAVLAILADTSHNCVICHASAASPSNGGLSFIPTPAMKDAAFATLVGKVSPGAPGSMCGGKTYVVAGSPDTSLLLSKVSAMPACGSRMPLGSTYKVLEQAELDTIRGWIMAGALNN
jgi:hypothetical protein